MQRPLKQSTTKTVKLGPFLDKTDGVTEEVGLAGTMAVKLSKDHGAIGDRNSATAITHDTLGYYAVELNATDTNTLGNVRVLAHAAGTHLAFFEDYTVLPANIFDSLF